MSYIVNGVTYETYSPENQRIIDKLVNREVYCCMTEEVEYMLSRVYENETLNPFDETDYEGLYVPVCENCGSTYGLTEKYVSELKDTELETGVYDFDVEYKQIDGYVCPVCKEIHKTADEARSCCGSTIVTADETVYRCEDCGCIFNEEEYRNLDTEIPEIYEWWAVSNWFGEKLKEYGQPVIEAWGKSYWGRTCTGQAISLDGVVCRIAADMHILKGMENDWSNYE